MTNLKAIFNYILEKTADFAAIDESSTSINVNGEPAVFYDNGETKNKECASMYRFYSIAYQRDKSELDLYEFYDATLDSINMRKISLIEGQNITTEELDKIIENNRAMYNKTLEICKNFEKLYEEKCIKRLQKEIEDL